MQRASSGKAPGAIVFTLRPAAPAAGDTLRPYASAEGAAWFEALMARGDDPPPGLHDEPAAPGGGNEAPAPPIRR